MASSSVISGVAGAVQSGWRQLQYQQARQQAEQAESQARQLRNEADVAQRNALRADEKAKQLDSAAVQAQNVAGTARQNLAGLSESGKLGQRLNQKVAASAAASTANIPQVSTNPDVKVADVKVADVAKSSGPVINSQGQIVGRVVNMAA